MIKLSGASAVEAGVVRSTDKINAKQMEYTSIVAGCYSRFPWTMVLLSGLRRGRAF